MSIERDLLISVLKLTKNGPVLIKHVNQDSRTPSDIVRKMIEKLQNEDLLYINGNNMKRIVTNDSGSLLK